MNATSQIVLGRIVCGAAMLAPFCASLAAQGLAHTAPIEIINGKPFVSAMVDGKGPFRFVIDTGTGGDAFVTAELATRLGLPNVGQAKLSDPSRMGGKRAPMVLIETLDVAGVQFTGVKAVEHTLAGAGEACDGLLGFTLFKDHLLTLDFPNRRILLGEGGLSPDGEHSVLPFRMPDGVPIVPIRINGLSVDAQIDSGGSGLSLPEQLVPRLQFEGRPAAFSNGESLATRFQIKSARLTTPVQIAGYTFDRPFVEINPAFPIANFGSYPMQSFAITFDQKNGLIRFAARHKSLHLAATPTPLRLDNAPAVRPVDASLVPIG